MLITGSESAIELADKVQQGTFWTYVTILLLAALVTVVFTIRLWQSTGKYQDAVRAEANARIAEAQATAAKANERSQELENKNLNLQRDVMILQLQFTDPDPKKSEAQFYLPRNDVLSGLDDLIDGGPMPARHPPGRSITSADALRGLSSEEQQNLKQALEDESKGILEIICATSGPSKIFADRIAGTCRFVGWTVNDLGESAMILRSNPEVILVLDDLAGFSPPSPLWKTLWDLKLRPSLRRVETRRGKPPLLIIGFLH